MYELKIRSKTITLIDIVLYIFGTFYLIFGLLLLSIGIHYSDLEFFGLISLFLIFISFIAFYSASRSTKEEAGRKWKSLIPKLAKVLVIFF